jgi:dTDP-4-amino-4,6-dideoxygalactose transaminase
VHYSPALNKAPAWRRIVKTPVPLPTAEELAGGVVSLPLFSTMSDAEQAAVITTALGSRHRHSPSLSESSAQV